MGIYGIFRRESGERIHVASCWASSALGAIAAFLRDQPAELLCARWLLPSDGFLTTLRRCHTDGSQEPPETLEAVRLDHQIDATVTLREVASA